MCSDCWELCCSLDEVGETALFYEASADTLFDIQTSKNQIIQYMKHQVRDTQQRKAKSWCFNRLDDKTGFWLKDFCQKILPVRYREGQKEYFGKKGMSLHVDVFFILNNGRICKKNMFSCKSDHC